MAEKRRSKFVSVRYSGILYELGGISGPILIPTWMDIDIVKTLVYNNRIVYEHAITDPTQYMVLDKENYEDFSMFPGNDEIKNEAAEGSNTYFLGIKDQPISGKEEMQSGFLYAEIF